MVSNRKSGSRLKNRWFKMACYTHDHKDRLVFYGKFLSRKKDGGSPMGYNRVWKGKLSDETLIGCRIILNLYLIDFFLAFKCNIMILVLKPENYGDFFKEYQNIVLRPRLSICPNY